MKTDLVLGLVTLLEAIEPGKWLVRMIKKGKSANGNVYSATCLKRAVADGVFDGVAAQAMQFKEGTFHHLPPSLQSQYPNGFADTTVGLTTNARYSQEHGGVVADLVLNEATQGWFESVLKLCHKVTGAKPGWSIKGGGSYEPGSETKVKRITAVDSLDFVTHPAAGGTTLGPITESEEVALAEALSTELQELAKPKEQTMDKKKLKKLLARARERGLIAEARELELLEACDETSMAIAESLDAIPEPEAGEPEPEVKPEVATTEAITEARLNEAIEARVAAIERGAERQTALAEALAGCALEDVAKARIRQTFTGRSDWTDADLQAAITEEVAYIGSLTGRTVSSTGISAGMTSEDKLVAGFARNWGCELEESEQGIEEIDIPRMHNLLSGGRDPSYRHWPNIPPESNTTTALAEAAVASNTLSNVIQTVGQRWMQKEYAELPNIATTIASAEMALSDFKRTEQPVLGGFAKLPAITTEGKTLADAAVPGDLKTYMDPVQYGNILTITRKMMVNNDLNVIQRMLKYWAQGAVVTLEYAAIKELMVDNATWADGTALYHADHGNLDATINLTTDPFGVFASAESMMTAQTIKTLASAGSTALRRMQNDPYYCIVGAPAGKQAARGVLIAENIRVGTTYSLSDTATETSTVANAYKYYLGDNHERLLQSTVITSTDVGSWWVANPSISEGLMIGYVENRREPWMTREVTNSGVSFETGGSLRYSMMFEFGVAWGHYSSTAYVDA